MDIFIKTGIEWIVLIQSLGGWLEIPMRLFSFLGSEEFFLLALPALYWCIDAQFGLRVGIILLVSTSLNNLLKLVFIGPRPYWVSTSVKPLAAEHTFGVPSGHSETAMGVWGISAWYLRKAWAWAVAIVVIALIGFSRLYLGVHFPHDVFFGWAFGALTLWAFTAFWDRTAAWLKGQTFINQVALAFGVSLLFVICGALLFSARSGYVLPAEWMTNAARAGELPAPVSMEGVLTPAGTLFGLALGLAWMNRQGGYQASGPVMKRALRYILGLVGILVFWFALGAVFPRQEDLISYVLRYFRYVLVGFWVSGGAPWLFLHFNLADKPKG